MLIKLIIWRFWKNEKACKMVSENITGCQVVLFHGYLKLLLRLVVHRYGDTLLPLSLRCIIIALMLVLVKCDDNKIWLKPPLICFIHLLTQPEVAKQQQQKKSQTWPMLMTDFLWYRLVTVLCIISYYASKTKTVSFFWLGLDVFNNESSSLAWFSKWPRNRRPL